MEVVDPTATGDPAVSPGRLPSSAEVVLEAGVLCYLAVGTSHGPHATPVVFALDRGRLWVTTARSSVKARAWRREPSVAGLVRVGDSAVTFRGRVRVYDALDPWTWPASALAGPWLASAGLRFSAKNARFYAGYAVDARHVPMAWMPPGRVFVAIDLEAGHVLDLAAGRVAASWGAWRRGAAPRASAEALRRRRPLDARAPAEIRSVIGGAGDGALALAGRNGALSVFPVGWRRRPSVGAYEAPLPVDLLRLAGAGARTRAGLVVDRASRWRASHMRGLLLQGEARVSRSDDAAALVTLVPDRVVWWTGWSGGTLKAR